MKLQTAKCIVTKLNENGIQATVYENYSGRGMFGRTTAGVELGQSYDLGHAQKLCRTLGKVNRDSLGLGLILY
jgi:hypothetical protein